MNGTAAAVACPDCGHTCHNSLRGRGPECPAALDREAARRLGAPLPWLPPTWEADAAQLLAAAQRRSRTRALDPGDVGLVLCSPATWRAR